MRLPRERRIRASAEFNRLRQEGSRLDCGPFLLNFRRTGEAGPSRFAVIAAKKNLRVLIAEPYPNRAGAEFRPITGGILMQQRDRIDAPGETFVVFLAAYAVFRFGVEFTRANPPDILGLTRSQVFLLALSPLLAARVVSAWRRGVYDRVLPVARTPVRGAA